MATALIWGDPINDDPLSGGGEYHYDGCAKVRSQLVLSDAHRLMDS